MSNRRIIFVPYIGAMGGVERLALGLTDFLYKKGLRPSIVCFKQMIDLASYAKCPIKIHPLNPSRNVLSERRLLYRFLRELHNDDCPPPLLFDLKSAFYMGLIPPQPFYLHLTDPPSFLPTDLSKYAFSSRAIYPSLNPDSGMGPVISIQGEMVHRINRRGFQKALSVIAMTKKIAEELRRLYSIEPKVIHPGVEAIPSLHQSLGLESGVLRMLSIGRLEKNKRLDWILKALSHLEKSDRALSKRINWQLNIVGEGTEMDGLKRLAEQLGMTDRIVFHGSVSDIQAQELFSNTNLFIMPAVQGYGLPALEALANGVPVILHRESGVSEVLLKSPWVEIIENGIESLATAIEIMTDRICEHKMQISSIPLIPTEAEWAQDIATHCHWLE